MNRMVSLQASNQPTQWGGAQAAEGHDGAVPIDSRVTGTEV